MTEYAFVVASHVVDLCGDASSETFVSSWMLGNEEMVLFEGPLLKFYYVLFQAMQIFSSLLQHLS